MASPASPSRVVTARPSKAVTGSSHEVVALPSTRTVQAPQTPSPQPYFAAVRPSSSRRTARRLRSGEPSTSLATPLIVRRTDAWCADREMPAFRAHGVNSAAERPLASGQMVRHLTLDQGIEGSNPSSPANPLRRRRGCQRTDPAPLRAKRRSEEHTSELQSQFHLVCRLL